MLWLAYEFTGENIYRKTAEGLLPTFAERVDNMVGMGDHDIGFIYTLSMVAGYKVTGDKYMKEKAIAVCGLLEACRTMPLDDEHRKKYLWVAEKIMNSLIENYTTKDDAKSNGLLKHATYYAGNLGIDECCIWGDYFYMEALMRFLNPNWKKYW